MRLLQTFALLLVMSLITSCQCLTGSLETPNTKMVKADLEFRTLVEGPFRSYVNNDPDLLLEEKEAYGLAIDAWSFAVSQAAKALPEGVLEAAATPPVELPGEVIADE